VTLAVGGDICPVFRGEEAFLRAGPAALFGEVLQRIQSADLAVANLECPLIRRTSPVGKSGPVLGAAFETVRAIAAAGFRALTLANNHIMDHGVDGLNSTMEACASAGIETFGAGADLSEASRVLVLEVAGLRVGLLGAAEREFSIAGRRSSGAAPADLPLLWRRITEARHACDFLLVLLHAGADRYPYPSPNLQSLSRYLIDVGAGMVVCQHSHCPGALEEYSGGLIVYGQGNLFFDWLPNPGGSWNEGFVLHAQISRSGLHGYKLLPYRQCEEQPMVRALNGSEAEAFLRRIEARTREIDEDDVVEELWRAHCRAEAGAYYARLLGGGLRYQMRRALLERLGVAWRPFGPERRRLLGNLVRCETHREVLETILLDLDDRDGALRRP
jgi:poly-gamma-glutamate synthesis protein (capsule biosynthesis protein)